MSNIAAYVAGNLVDKTGKLFAKLTGPKSIKNGLIAAITVLIISQLFIFYVIIAARVNTADSWILGFKSLNCADCSIFLRWEMLITAAGLLFLDFKIPIFILSVVVLVSSIFIIRMIPDEWYEVGDLLAVLILLSAPAVIIGLAVLELLPYLINNYM